jgi:hypothetical protein
MDDRGIAHNSTGIEIVLTEESLSIRIKISGGGFYTNCCGIGSGRLFV